MLPISVVIPTYNRADVLRRTLNLLTLQTLDRRAFEVIIVDDGSTDATPDVLREWVAKDILKLKTFTQPNAGAGVARNRGLDAATGDIVVFLGDDMLPAPDLLTSHFRFHVHHPAREAACLGRVEWATDLSVTPFMQWLMTSGTQFRFHDLHADVRVDFRRFYTSNISLKRPFLGSERFDMRFHGWGFEDTELGFRLAARGLELRYAPDALVHHHHPMDDRDLARRMEAAGRNAVLFQSLHPTAGIVPTGAKRIVQKVFATLFAWTWWGIAKRAFLRGIAAAEAETATN